MDHSEVKHLPKVDHTPAVLDEASKVLLKAADYMEVHGKSDFGLTSKAKCAMYTIKEVSKGGTDGGAEWRFRDHCRASGYRDISHFNSDHSEPEVIARLRAVALGL